MSTIPSPRALYVTSDWKRFVPEGHLEARYGIQPEDIDRMGLREAYEAYTSDALPKQAEPKVIHTANAAAPADKAVRQHNDKSSRPDGRA